MAVKKGFNMDIWITKCMKCGRVYNGNTICLCGDNNS